MKAMLLTLVALLVLGPAATAVADEVSIADLVADPAAYDTGVVGAITVEGELVGDFQLRGDWVWVQVNGDAYAERALLDGGQQAGANVGIGARIPSDVFDSLGVETPGGYRVRGAIVSLTGDWRHHDPSRGGESWFDVRDAVLLRPEHHLEEPVDWAVMGTGLVLLALAGLFITINRRRERW